MKVIISGPRRLPDRDLANPWPHMHIELDLPYLPAVGEIIILNSGSSYVVRRRMWWVDGPENEAYWSWNGDYDTDEGRYQVAYLDVLPSEYDEPFTPDKMLAEGIARGREEMAAEVKKLLDLAASAPGADTPTVRVMIRALVQNEAARAAERAEQAARHAEFARRILAELDEEREKKPRPGPRERYPSTADWFAASKAEGCTGTGYSTADDTIEHVGPGPCPVHPGL
jgi:hypothetical protein